LKCRGPNWIAREIRLLIKGGGPESVFSRHEPDKKKKKGRRGKDFGKKSSRPGDFEQEHETTPLGESHKKGGGG